MGEYALNLGSVTYYSLMSIKIWVMGKMGEKVMKEKTLSCYGLLRILIKSGKTLVFSHLLYYYHEEVEIQLPIIT